VTKRSPYASLVLEQGHLVSSIAKGATHH